MGKSQFQISRSLDERIKRIISGSSEADTEFSNVQSAYILGFNYGNVTNCVGLTTNYQLHHAVFPVVGLVYFKQCPSDEDIKSNLKSIKNYSSSPNGLGSFKSDKNEHLFLIYSVIEGAQPTEVEKRIFNFSKGAFVRRKRHRLSVLNDPYCPKNVYNGTEDVFNLDADGDSMSSSEDDQVDHLIFFIHGVGGVCDVRFRSCVEVVADFKKMANTLLAQHSNPSSGASTPTNRHLANSLKRGFFRKQSAESSASRDSDRSETCPSSPSSSKRARKVECLPISWHSLTRRQTGVSEQLNLIALSSVPKLRHFLNKVVMDAMLYSSGPVFAQTIINNVGNEINRLYTLFMERHPNFTGSVSLAGHSLGSVIVFDLLAHQIASNFPSSDNVSASSGVRTTISSENSSANCTRADKINNNHNNSTSERGVNCRSECYNISHQHHNINKNNLGRFCSDYENIMDLLKDLDLEKYVELFRKEHINLDNLLLLTDFDLKELQLPLGARRKLGTYINFKKVAHIPLVPESQHGINNINDININNNNNDNTQTSGTDPTVPSYGNPYGNMNTGQCLVEYPQLKFKPRCFFAFGSPTPMFLNVRGIQQLSRDYKLPTCDQMLNIFHPYDPLAYRFEPLIDPRFKNLEPVLIPHHRGGKRIHVQLREGFARVGHDIKHRLLGSLRNTWTSFTRMGQTDDVSPPSELSPSSHENATSVGTSLPSAGSINQKKKRLTKSFSSSAEVGERESFESCRSSFSQPSDSSQHSGLQQASCKPARNPLKRQQIIRSQSEVASGAGTASLCSIIESSMREDPVESECSLSDPEVAVSDHMRSMKINSTSATVEAEDSNDYKQHLNLVIGRDKKENNEKKEPTTEKRGEQDSESSEAAHFDQTRIGLLNRGRRIDYVLQEKPIELFNEYIFAFTSHANYWQNEDSALIILNEIYQADGVQLLDPSEY